MAKSSNDSGPKNGAQAQSRYILKLLRGQRNPPGAEGRQPEATGYSARSESLSAFRVSSSEVQEGPYRPALPSTSAPQRHLAPVGECLARSDGPLATLLAHTRRLVELNRIFLAYLPPNFRDHATLARMDSEAWVVQTDSSAWATRLRYGLPSIRQQLGRQVGIPLPPPRIRIAPPEVPPPPPPSPRRMVVTEGTVDTLESAARNLDDPRLGAAMMRLAHHARQHKAEGHADQS